MVGCQPTLAHQWTPIHLAVCPTPSALVRSWGLFSSFFYVANSAHWTDLLFSKVNQCMWTEIYPSAFYSFLSNVISFSSSYDPPAVRVVWKQKAKAARFCWFMVIISAVLDLLLLSHFHKYRLAATAAVLKCHFLAQTKAMATISLYYLYCVTTFSLTTAY